MLAMTEDFAADALSYLPSYADPAPFLSPDLALEFGGAEMPPQLAAWQYAPAVTAWDHLQEWHDWSAQRHHERRLPVVRQAAAIALDPQADVEFVAADEERNEPDDVEDYEVIAEFEDEFEGIVAADIDGADWPEGDVEPQADPHDWDEVPLEEDSEVGDFGGGVYPSPIVPGSRTNLARSSSVALLNEPVPDVTPLFATGYQFFDHRVSMARRSSAD
jgi:hypothetical protein